MDSGRNLNRSGWQTNDGVIRLGEGPQTFARTRLDTPKHSDCAAIAKILGKLDQEYT
jgi:hypothetical protein